MFIEERHQSILDWLKENVSVIMLGGEMDKKGNCYDSIAIDTVRKLSMDKCFIQVHFQCTGRSDV